MKSSSAIFLLFFSLYLWTMPPTLAPYRDAGEMAASAYTLGVSHPPSYPLYILIGHLAGLLPLGNIAFRLNLLSASAGAAALAILHRTVQGGLPGAVLVLLLGLNATFWNVCCVQEMYSLTLLGLALLLSLALRLRGGYEDKIWFAFVFLYGLFLGNRTDILLWAPGLLCLAVPGWRGFSWAGKSLGLAALGLSVYLYLPLRSSQGPWLDWNHPAQFANFIASITRKGYGSTLDLLSKNYAPGSMFLPNLGVYAKHVWDNFSFLGVVLAGIGFFRQLKRDRGLALASILLYGASGPLFLYMANMPPNPHALAIVEPHYLLSDFILALWAADGIAALAADKKTYGLALFAAAALALQPWVLGRWFQMNRRDDWIGYDYAHNILRCVPPASVLVAKKDVQLFSLWYYQKVELKRPDVAVVAQGLAHSPWYQAAQKREVDWVRLGPLRAREDWKRFLSENERVVATMDVEFLEGAPLGQAQGLGIFFTNPNGSSAQGHSRLWDFMVRRGDYRYERRPDFFTADLVESYALARQRLALNKMDRDAAEARKNLLAAWTMNWRMPEIPSLLGFLHYREGRLAQAASLYELAAELYDRTMALTRQYHSLPELSHSVRTAAADALLNLGVIYERLKDPDKAESAYRRTLSINPMSAKAHYNLAVLYWDKDWPRVISELEEALRVDPTYPDALKYLPIARAQGSR